MSSELSRLKGLMRDAITADPAFTVSMTKVMSCLLAKINGKRFEATGKAEAWPSLRTICRRTGLSQRAVLYARQRLKEMKAIKVARNKGGRPWPGHETTALVMIDLHYEFNSAKSDGFNSAKNGGCNSAKNGGVTPHARAVVTPNAASDESLERETVEAASAVATATAKADAAASTSSPSKSPPRDPPPARAALPGGYAQAGGLPTEPRTRTEPDDLAPVAQRLLSGCGLDRPPDESELATLEEMLKDLLIEDIEAGISRRAAQMIAVDPNWLPQGLIEFLDYAWQARNERLGIEGPPPKRKVGGRRG
jgi:hypothetical protein